MAGADSLTRHDSQLGFEDLPKRTRAIIYRMLFTQAAPVDIETHGATNFSRSAHILRVCRLIYREGADVLYEQNQFLFR
jgi:hypothetical protein